MSAQINLGGGTCCAQPTKGYRLLVFSDGSQAGVTGLDEIFEEAYGAGKAPDLSVAADLVERLSGKNYIPPGQELEYGQVVLKEYRKFFEGRERNK